MTFWRPPTLVLRIRRTYWKSSPIIIAMVGDGGGYEGKRTEGAKRGGSCRRSIGIDLIDLVQRKSLHPWLDLCLDLCLDLWLDLNMDLR